MIIIKQFVLALFGKFAATAVDDTLPDVFAPRHALWVCDGPWPYFLPLKAMDSKS